MDFFKKNNIYDFVKYSRYGLCISIFIIVYIIIFLFIRGISLGIDFSGGNIVQIQYSSKDAPIPQIRDILNKNALFKDVQIIEFGSKDEIVIKFNLTSNEELNIQEIINSSLRSTGEFEIRRVDTVGPRAGSELAKKGFMAFIVSLLAIMIYVSFRYEWRFALAGIIALLHDIIISGASIVLFNVDLSLDVIAAFLTLLGYSINDTIIIFDRIREQLQSRKFNSIESVINDAISITLSRTLLTSITVFLVILILFLFGSEMLIGFTIPMLIGSVVGTYSSIFIAPRLIMLFGFDIQKYYKREDLKAKKKIEKQKLRELYEHGRV